MKLVGITVPPIEIWKDLSARIQTGMSRAERATIFPNHEDYLVLGACGLKAPNKIQRRDIFLGRWLMRV